MLPTIAKHPTAQIAHLVFADTQANPKKSKSLSRILYREAVFFHRSQTVDKFEKINH